MGAGAQGVVGDNRDVCSNIQHDAVVGVTGNGVREDPVVVGIRDAHARTGRAHGRASDVGTDVAVGLCLQVVDLVEARCPYPHPVVAVGIRVDVHQVV